MKGQISMVLVAIKEGCETSFEIEAATGLPQDSVRVYLQRLAHIGQIDRDGRFAPPNSRKRFIRWRLRRAAA